VDRDGETLLLAGEGVGEVAGEAVGEAVGERVLDVHQMIRQPVIRPEISLCLERDKVYPPSVVVLVITGLLVKVLVARGN
jgi:hypothetical protein